MPGNSQESAEVGPELTDADILDAMRHIPGYLDISTEDFRAIYRLAHRHALERLSGSPGVAMPMRTGVEVLDPGMPLLDAAKKLAASGLKCLPVADGRGRVLGMLTEADFLRHLNMKSLCELLVNLAEDGSGFSRCCRETPVSDAMSAPAVTLGKDAGYGEALEAFRRHDVRGLPVVDDEGRLLGLSLRKDFMVAYGRDET